MATEKLTISRNDVTSQSLRALDAMSNSRGPEPLRDALEFISSVLHAGVVVTISYDYEDVSSE